MDLGTLLAIVGVIAAALSYFIDKHAQALLVIGVVLIGVALLVGADPLVTKT